MTDPLLLTDPEGRIFVANAVALDLLSSGEQESEGRRRAVALNNMLFSAALSSVAYDRSPQPREVLLVDSSEGQDLLFELLCSHVDVSGLEPLVVCVLRDVSDLRQATEEIEHNYRKLRVAEAEVRAERDRLNLILRSVADPILVTDPAGDIVILNPPAERIFATRDDAEEAQRRVRTNDAMFSSFLSSLYTDASLEWRRELTLSDPEGGGAIPVQAIAGKVLSKQGELTAVVTILHDQTEAVEKARLFEQVTRHSEELRERVREATSELARQNEMLRRQAIALEQASALKSQFLANVSHELRTPLNAILGYTQFLLQGMAGEIPDRPMTRLGRIDANAKHLLSIINDLLDIARIESGKMPVRVEEVCLETLLEEVVAEVEPLIDRANLDVDYDITPKIRSIRTDRQKLKQIILNLLSNALKFTSRGFVRIDVGLVDQARDVVIAVRDSGVGISEADQERNLRRVPPGRRFSRSGLDRHRSRPVDLQAACCHTERRHPRPKPARGGLYIYPTGATQPGGLMSTIAKRSKRGVQEPLILVVDDFDDGREFVIDVLLQYGFEVHGVSNGAAALEAAETLRPDAILMDLSLPVMDGTRRDPQAQGERIDLDHPDHRADGARPRLLPGGRARRRLPGVLDQALHVRAARRRGPTRARAVPLRATTLFLDTDEAADVNSLCTCRPRASYSRATPDVRVGCHR